MKNTKTKTKIKNISIDDTKPVGDNGSPGGNGNKPAQALGALVTKPPIIPSDVVVYDTNEKAKDIPGNGFYFNVEDKYLPESTRLTERQIQCFSLGDVQQEVLNPLRAKSVYEMYRDRYQRYEISNGGEGRAEFSTLAQLKVEEGNKKKGDLFDQLK